MKKNKLNSYVSSIDIQINQVNSQLVNTKSNLKNVKTQILNLENQKNIQIKQLNNQSSQIENNISSINIQLTPSFIYAWVSWKIKTKNTSKWNKVGPNSLLCQIVPDKSSLKLRIGMPEDLPEDYQKMENWFGYVEFGTNKWLCKVKVISKLPYKDPITQNNIYETESVGDCRRFTRRLSEDKKGWQKIKEEGGDKKIEKVDLVDVLQEGQVLSVKYIRWENKFENWNEKIFIPLDFVVNKITGQFVKKQVSTWNIQEVPVKLWNIDGTKVEILSWLKIGDRVCR